MKTLSAATVSKQNNITDVIDFFFNLIDKYECFEQDIVNFIDLIPGFSPQQIFDECNKIWETRNKLATLDQQMFEIIELAGDSMGDSPVLQDYQQAFQKANTACSLLYQELSVYKDSLQSNKSVACSPCYQ